MPFINDKLGYYKKQNELEQEVENDSIETENKDSTIKKGIPSRFIFDIDGVITKLKNNIYGQEKAIDAIENMLKVVRADISDPNRPLYVGLFLGPTGVGKTEIVRILSQAIYGNPNEFCRVDMNTLSSDHYSAALTGAPPGYVGSKEGSSLLDKEKIQGAFSKPGIVLFDEIEKASQQVIQTLLNVFDNGIMAVTSGEEVIDFRNSIIIMTSNIGAKQIYNYKNQPNKFLLKKLIHQINFKNDKTLLEKIINNSLENTFSPEFINRIEDIIIFEHLHKDSIVQMVDLFINNLSDKLKKHNCEISLNQEANLFLAEKGYDPRFGGRFLRKIIKKYVQVPLSDELIMKENTAFFITYKGYMDQKKESILFDAIIKQ